MLSGGEALAAFGTVASAGVASAPSAAVVVAVMAADAAASLLAVTRSVAHTSAYYGYDPTAEEEQLSVLAAVNLATASTQAEKTFAYQEFNVLVQALVRNKTWAEWNTHAVTKIMQRIYGQLGERLTKSKLGQAVPVLGIAIGAGLNDEMLRKAATNAHFAYRERFLREKYGIDFDPTPVADDHDDSISVIRELDERTTDVMHVSGTHEASAPASIERCLHELAAAEKYPDWYTGVKTVEVKTRDERGRPTLISLVIDTGVPKYGEIPVELEYEWRDDPAGVALRRIAGKPTRVDGLWMLTPEDGRTKIALTLELDIPTGMPGLVERRLGLADKIGDLMIKDPVEDLLKRVEATGT